MPDVAIPYPTLTGMLAPALFMTATGSLLISANNRLARIVDRLRVLLDQLDKIGQGTYVGDLPEERERKLLNTVARQKKRAAMMLGAITRLHLAFASFVGTSLTLAVDSWTGRVLTAVPTGLALAGVVLLLLGGFNLYREARGGVAILNDEVEFMEALRQRRQQARDRSEGNPP